MLYCGFDFRICFRVIRAESSGDESAVFLHYVEQRTGQVVAVIDISRTLEVGNIVQIKEVHETLVVCKDYIGSISLKDAVVFYDGLLFAKLDELYDHEENIEEKGVRCLISTLEDEFMHEPVDKREKSY